jgi:hypothetical protein
LSRQLSGQLRVSDLFAGEWERRSVKMLGIELAMQSVASHEGIQFSRYIAGSMCWAKALGIAVALRYSRTVVVGDFAWAPALYDDIGLELFEIPAVELLVPLAAPDEAKSLHLKLPPKLWLLIDNEVRVTGVALGVLLAWIGLDYLIKVGRYPPEFAQYKPKARRSSRLVAA